jgi:hypothetical protein
MVLALLGACRQEPAELADLSASMRAYERGQAALAAGDAAEAVEAFVQARATRPDDPVLAQWHARALSRSGDAAAAERILDRLLSKDPALVSARYDRGILRLNRGDPSGSEDIRAAVDAGVRSPAAAARDPDLAPHRASLPFLPPTVLRVTFEVGSASARVGVDVVVAAEVQGVLDAPWTLDAPGASGPVDVVMAAETVRDGGETHQLTWVLRAHRPGIVDLPALVVRQGAAEGRAVGGSYDVTSATEEGRAGSVGLPSPGWTLLVPSHQQDGALPAAEGTPRGWSVAWAADTRMIVEPASTQPTLRTSLRVVDGDGTWLRAVERAWFTEVPERVTVLRGAVIEGQWPSASAAR